jgi:AraC family transcriptional regulator, regulatory protein of adaptative response / DNA-3-methyladenine glycosylase II
MEGVGAVVTTGIYCRPGCGAQPNPENVSRYLSAAMAEGAGYRACLRCRPYRLPPEVPSTGPELVCRAVRLILEGALDGCTEAELAGRLGVSHRHLRRLFVDNLGATPQGLARSARAHFARRLLDDTDLPITDIAFSTGFGSLRQFNRACRSTFHATPRQLRSKRRATDRLVADGGFVLRLPFLGALDWPALLRHLEAWAIPGVESIVGDAYRRTIVVGGDPGVLEMWRGGDDHLLLRLHLPHWEELLHVANRARRIASLDSDPAGALPTLKADPALEPIITLCPGLRVPGAWDPFEIGVRAILDRYDAATAAQRVIGLVIRWGRRVQGLGPLGLSYTFPTPGALADANPDSLGLAAAVGRTVRAFAHAVETGAVRLDRSMAPARLQDALLVLPGLTPSTAQYIAWRIGEPDAFPVGQPGFESQALEGLLPRRAEVVGRSERWRPWRALAAAYLWQPPLRRSRV